MYLNVCEDSNFLSTVLLVKTILDIIKVFVPILLILLCAIDLGKQVLNPEDKKNYSKILKRSLGAVAVFFIPTIMTLFLDMVGTQNYKTTACWTNANNETISLLSAQKKQEQAAQEEALRNENEAAQREREELAANREEIRRANEERAEAEREQNGSSGGSSSNVVDATLYHENGTDGMVEVVNGVFYKPANGTSGADGTKGSAPYGYNIFFYNRLVKFINDAAAAGHTISMSTTEYGAWRPLANQQYFWDCYQNQNCNNGNLAAYPGTSMHGWGIASDLDFGSYNAKLWAHDNVSRYGLNFSECQNIRGSCNEDWHIQAARIESR